MECKYCQDSNKSGKNKKKEISTKKALRLQLLEKIRNRYKKKK